MFSYAAFDLGEPNLKARDRCETSVGPTILANLLILSQSVTWLVDRLFQCHVAQHGKRQAADKGNYAQPGSDGEFEPHLPSVAYDLSANAILPTGDRPDTNEVAQERE